MAIESITLGSLDLTDTDLAGVQWGVESIAGWGAPAGTLAVVQKPRQAGAWAGLSYSKSRPLALKGHAVLPDGYPSDMAADRLISAVSLDSTALAVTESGRTRTAYVRRDGDVIITWPIGSTNYFEWSVQVVAVDPRKFGDTATASTGLPSSSGGLTVPFTLPSAINSAVVSGQVSLQNSGNTTGPVSLIIAGPVTGPVVTHVGTGRTLTFSSSLTLAAGEFITVDMERHEVLAQGQSSRNGWVTGRGWSGFEPGPNTWSFSALSADPLASMTVNAIPAWE